MSASSCWDRSRVRGPCGITCQEGATRTGHKCNGDMRAAGYHHQTSKDLSDTRSKSCRLQILSSGVSILGSRISDLDPRISDLGSWISILGFRFSNLDSRILNLESRISVLESPFSNLESRIRCQVLSELLSGKSEFWRTTSSSRSHSATPPCLK